MPELPEVETTRSGIASYIVGKRVREVNIRTAQLRLPISIELANELPGQIINAVERRAKYLLLRANTGTAILHLGMTGNLRWLTAPTEPGRHDHLDIVFHDASLLRFHDPRRFGLALWTRDPPLDHPVLCTLGPEPLGEEFDGEYLYRRARGRSVALKSFLMDQHIVVGVGNIYASEALFLAGIHPAHPAQNVAQERYTRLAAIIRQLLTAAIAQGGTTFRDFHDATGRPGYFQRALCVYGRAGDPCPKCGQPIRVTRHGQRSTFYCAQCQD